MNQKERATEKITLSVAEAAEQLGISRPVLLNWIHMSGGIPHFHAGRKILIPKKMLEEWVNKQAEMGAVL